MVNNTISKCIDKLVRLKKILGEIINIVKNNIVNSREKFFFFANHKYKYKEVKDNNKGTIIIKFTDNNLSSKFKG